MPAPPALSIIFAAERPNASQFVQELAEAIPNVPFEVLVPGVPEPQAGPFQPARVRGIGGPDLPPSDLVAAALRQAAGERIVVLDPRATAPAASVAALWSAGVALDADLVIGDPKADASRASAGERIAAWALRKLARLALSSARRHGVRDPTSQSFLVRRNRVPDPGRRRPRGPSLLPELIASHPYEKLPQVEVPLGPGDMVRRADGAKVTLSSFAGLGRLAIQDREARRVAAFAIVGVSGIVVNLAPILMAERLLRITDPVWLLAWATLSRELAVVWNFLWNDIISFRDLRAATGRSPFARLIRFHVATLISLLLYGVIFYGLIVAGLPTFAAAAIAILGGFATNYAGNLKWTYARPKRFTGTAA